MSNIWGYRPTVAHATDNALTGYKVEATDGSIGKVDKHSGDVRAQYLVVDTGPWIFGAQVLLPAGTVVGVDEENEKIFVDRTKEQIRNAPQWDREKHIGDASLLDEIGRYYGSTRI